MPPRRSTPAITPNPAISPEVLVGLLADETRREVIAALVLGRRSVREIVESTRASEPKIVRALDRLFKSGLVQTGPDGLTIAPMAFEHAARAAAMRHADTRDAAVVRPEELGATAEQAAVLRNFLDRDGRLRSIPVQASKRRVVLDFLAQRFEPGKIYPERDVNFELAKVHADMAALRRYLVDEGLLERRDGFYWRVGGTFEVESVETS